jgi:hypothetical protein
VIDRTMIDRTMIDRTTTRRRHVEELPMSSAPTANQVHGRAIGALFLTGFGALWFLLGLFVRQELNLASLCWILGCALTLAAAAMHLLRRAVCRSSPPEDLARARAFYSLNAAQWIVIFLALTLLHRLRLDDYGLSVIAAIVGLHFFPLARLFRNPLHHFTGALLLAWSLYSSFALPPDSLEGVTALGAGALLWLSAAITLALCALALRRRPLALRSRAA